MLISGYQNSNKYEIRRKSGGKILTAYVTQTNKLINELTSQSGLGNPDHYLNLFDQIKTYLDSVPFL